MKDHKVQITRNFKDLKENILRELGTKTEVFMCTKERYEYLSSKGAVKLLSIKEQPKKETVKKEIKTQPKKKTTKKKTKIDK